MKINTTIFYLIELKDEFLTAIPPPPS